MPPSTTDQPAKAPRYFEPRTVDTYDFCADANKAIKAIKAIRKLKPEEIDDEKISEFEGYVKNFTQGHQFHLDQQRPINHQAAGHIEEALEFLEAEKERLCASY